MTQFPRLMKHAYNRSARTTDPPVNELMTITTERNNVRLIVCAPTAQRHDVMPMFRSFSTDGATPLAFDS